MTLAFFRRHRKLFMILMILAVVLMAFWFVLSQVPVVIQRWFGPQRLSRKIAEVYGKPVTLGEAVDFNNRLIIAAHAARLTFMLLAPKQPDEAKLRELEAITIGSLSPYAQQIAGDRGRDLGEDDVWAAFIIYQEARQLGFDVPTAMLNQRLEALKARGLTAADYQELLRIVPEGGQDLLFEAWRQDLILLTYIDFMAGLPKVLGPELEQRFRVLGEKAEVELVVLDAKDFVDQVKEIPEEALKKQFVAYKNLLPGEQGPGSPGYKIPDKVKVEYLVVSPDAFADQVKITDEDIEKYYKEHKETEFVLEPENKEGDEKPNAEEEKSEEEAPDSAAEPTADESAEDKKEGDEPGAEAEGKPAEVAAPPAEPAVSYKPLEDVRDEIRKKLFDMKTRQLAREKMAAVSSELVALSARREPIDFETFADGVLVRLVRPEGLMTGEQLGELQDIGQAVSEGGVPFAAYALSLKELATSPEEQRLLSVGRESGMLADPAGNQYIFMCTAAEKAREPTSIEEVREAVERDVRLEEAFKLAEESAREILDAAKEVGLEAAAKKRKLEVHAPEPFPQGELPAQALLLAYFGYPVRPIVPDVPPIGRDRNFVALCFELAQDKEKNVELLALKETKTVLVVELKDVHLPVRSEFEEQKPLLYIIANTEAKIGLLGDFLKPANVQRRARFRLLEEKREPKDKAEERQPANP